MPFLPATADIVSTSQGVPNVWVATMAEVLTPMARAADSGESVRVAGSMSANTGRSPFHATAWAVAAKVNEGMTTSPESSVARMTNMSPAVHDDTATQCCTWR